LVQGSLVCAGKTTEVANSSTTLGKAIQRARERAGMTQAALAKALGVPQGVVARLETGGRPDPRLSTVLAVANALGVSIDALVEDAGLTPVLPSRRVLHEAVIEAVGTARRVRKELTAFDRALSQIESLGEGPTKRRRGSHG
jgi:transcriptional regulator with XRE-family HTH domain